ncbi:MAG: CocE/NonD family hydrolase [Nitrospinota bacterium]|nr:MAG: CocE/NonD family hydrolase [Nitrospinota bacterium]
MRRNQSVEQRTHTTPLSAPEYEITVEKDVTIPMRDGTRLKADIYRPQSSGKFPVLLERTPYSKENSSEVQVGAPEYFARRGYVVVIQDVRGRYASEGEFYPFRDDGWGPNRDGYDTVEWAASQPWSSGAVGTIGGSYSGATQYRLAPTRPPHLRAMFVRESSSDYHEEWVYRGGALELGFVLHWALNHITLKNLPRLVGEEDLPAWRGRLERGLLEIESWYQHLPLSPFPLIEGLSDWYHDWLAHPDDGPYWWQWNIALKHQEIDVPIYHLGGWFDIFQRGTIVNFQGIRQRGRTLQTRQAQKLIMGPWIHGPANVSVSQVGEVDFGPEAAIDFNGLRLRWFDYWLKGRDTGIMEEPPVRYFVMGKNRWQEAEDWPPPGIRYLPYYFRQEPSGSIDSLNDGSLSLTPPAGAERPDSYLYDPARPIPNRGGATLYIPGGPYDQRAIDELCVTYTTAPLAEDIEIAGPVTATLYALSTARDTDWVVRLSDVFPDGRSLLVTDGILRARYRESRARPALLTPGQVYRFVIDLWHTSYRFPAGHRIRVAVTSSNFPRWDRNLNTGGPFGREVQGEVALQTIFHDMKYPSHLLLPVLE